MLASLLYPYDDDSRGLVESWLSELVREKCVRRYTVAGDEYLEVLNWLSHQKIDKPSKSKFPAFDETSRNLVETSSNPPRAIDERSCGDQGRDQGREGIKEGKGEDLPPSTANLNPAVERNLKSLVGVVIGKDLEKPKSILVSETNGDLEKSAPECSLSTIPTSLPETNGMEDPSVAQNSPTPEAVEQGWAMLALLATEDENQGATPPPQPQQARVEALVGAKPTSNQPAAVTFDEWPESVDWVEAIKNLIRAHPRPTIGCATTTAAIEQVDNVQQFRGGTKWDAYTYLLERVMLYKAATDKWPEDRKSRITGVLKFLQGEEYQQDEAIWNYSSRDGRDNKGTGNIPSVEEALREDGEAGSTGDSPKRIIPFVRAEDIKRKQQAARPGAYGRRSGTAYPRTF